MKRMIKQIGLIVTLLIIAAGIMGCNTMEGAGEDIENAGEAIKDAAD